MRTMRNVKECFKTFKMETGNKIKLYELLDMMMGNSRSFYSMDVCPLTLNSH